MFSLFETFFFWMPLTFILIGLFFIFFLPFNSMISNFFNFFILSMYSHFSKVVYSSLHYIVVLMLFILFFNVFSLVPSVYPLTSMPSFTLMMGILLWGGGYIMCLFYNFKSCVAHFLPSSAPMYLGVVLVWIEFLSWLCRPIALGVRLMANITASHLLLHLFSISAFFMSSNIFTFLPVFILLFLLFFLEVAVAFIQSYVYSLLLSLYMNEGME